MRFFAHSGTTPPDTADSDWQLLAEHLRNVAALAERFAEEASPTNPTLAAAARVAGLLHDLGKYRPGFQEHIKGRTPAPPDLSYHKQAGAAKCWVEFKHYPLALAIQGHHGGIPNAVELKELKSVATGMPAVAAVWATAVKDCAELAHVMAAMPKFTDAHACDLFTRMLFSCLVDADWTDTGNYSFVIKKWADEPPPPPLDSETRLKNVLAFIERKAAACKESAIRVIRDDILKACLKAAEEPPGVFTLTVPTGGGKTLSGLAFALRHAAKHGQRRVIYVAPYMSILEQNIGVMREALGVGPNAADVFEHYSLAEPPGDNSTSETRREDAARRAENWDAPVVTTTNVQFFESLFSHKPGRCRKLHNIARSVVILDECQTLPPDLVAPTCGILKQLTADYGCTVILCTATQPTLDHEKIGDYGLTAREIVPPELALFARLKRVRVTWPAKGEFLTWGQVANEMRAGPAGLCVVNTKRAARELHKELLDLGTQGLFHLSTGMCPAHRKAKLEVIRKRLLDGQPCFLVSTQLIEAGVDVDFPRVWREMSPFESIIQAAGRCNREGRMAGAGGQVRVFRSVACQDEPARYYPPGTWYKMGRDRLENHFLAVGRDPQVDDPAAIREYFEILYQGGNLDKHDIQGKRRGFDFQDTATHYRLIDNAGEPVVITTWYDKKDEVAELLDGLRARPRKALFRELARYQVNVMPNVLGRSSHLLMEGPCELKLWTGKYDDDVGIVEEMPDDFIV